MRGVARRAASGVDTPCAEEKLATFSQNALSLCRANSITFAERRTFRHEGKRAVRQATPWAYCIKGPRRISFWRGQAEKEKSRKAEHQ